MKTITLVRGVSGSGKTTFAESLVPPGIVISADDFFMVDGKYEFDVTKLGLAHDYCNGTVKMAMIREEEKIYVANTFTREREMKPYFKLAEEFGYRVNTVIVENRHGGMNVHKVPEEVLLKQKERFNIKL